LAGAVQGADDVGGADGAEHPGLDAQARVVVDDVEDLDGGAFGEGPVRDVGLPAFVREVGREAFERRFGSLVRLGCDEAAGFEDPPDGGE
jgi:hypothetical protein